jgi:hypothetical protein
MKADGTGCGHRRNHTPLRPGTRASPGSTRCRNYRCRGFAAALVADLCGRILKMGKIPLLYTDGDNPASNKSYKNAGFEVVGELHTARVQF